MGTRSLGESGLTHRGKQFSLLCPVYSKQTCREALHGLTPVASLTSFPCTHPQAPELRLHWALQSQAQSDMPSHTLTAPSHSAWNILCMANLFTSCRPWVKCHLLCDRLFKIIPMSATPVSLPYYLTLLFHYFLPLFCFDILFHFYC